MPTDKYKESGVDLETANRLVDVIKPILQRAPQHRVIGGIGGFGGLYDLDGLNFDQPVIVASTDGVGTKLKVASWANKHDTVGIDLVAMSVNDIIVQGATPLFFLDYIATGQIDLDIVKQLITGIVEGCKQASCALLGGETAEMPGFYTKGEYDMAGFATGFVNRDSIVDGTHIKPGHKMIGLASSGLHSNGYSLARKIFLESDLNFTPDSLMPGYVDKTVADILLEPTRIYVKPVIQILRRFKVAGMVHVTGGGFYDNIPRILPDDCQARIEEGSWDVHPVFNFMQDDYDISQKEMYRVFNCGIGYILIVNPDYVDEIMSLMSYYGCNAFVIGEIVARNGGAAVVIEE